MRGGEGVGGGGRGGKETNKSVSSPTLVGSSPSDQGSLP